MLINILITTPPERSCKNNVTNAKKDAPTILLRKVIHNYDKCENVLRNSLLYEYKRQQVCYYKEENFIIFDE